MYWHLRLRVLFESSVFREYNIDQEIDTDKQLLQNITNIWWLFGLNHLMRSSACRTDEQLHWPLLIWLPYMVH